MTSEKIMDALSFLDDGLLAEVDALRSKRKNRFPWRKVLPIAACFGLVLAGVLAWSQFDLPADVVLEETGRPAMDGTPEQEQQEDLPCTDSTDETLNDGYTGGGVSENDDGVHTEISDNLGGNGDGSVPESEGATDGGPPETNEVPSVILRIDRMENGGFRGTVVEIVDADIFPVGTEVIVEFLDGVSAKNLAEGDCVHVMFDGFDGNTLYAENVWRVDE